MNLDQKTVEEIAAEFSGLVLKTALWCGLAGFIGGAFVGTVLTLAYLGVTR